MSNGYIWKRLLRSLLSVMIIMLIVFTMIFTLVPRENIFFEDSTSHVVPVAAVRKFVTKSVFSVTR